MVVCLLLDLGLKAAFEFKGKVVLKDGDPVDQSPDHSFVVVRFLFGQAFQRRDEPLELPPADAALPDFGGKGVSLRLCTETKKPRHQPTAG